MLNQPVALEDLDGVILDFGGVLYDIDYDAPPEAFAKLGDSDFASLYHQASQSPWFDDLETGRLDKDAFTDTWPDAVPPAQPTPKSTMPGVAS